MWFDVAREAVRKQNPESRQLAINCQLRTQRLMHTAKVHKKWDANRLKYKRRINLIFSKWNCRRSYVSNVKAVSLIITLTCLGPGHPTLTSRNALVSGKGPVYKLFISTSFYPSRQCFKQAHHSQPEETLFA